MRQSRVTLAISGLLALIALTGCGDATKLGNRAIIRSARALSAANGAGHSAPKHQLERGEAQ